MEPYKLVLAGYISSVLTSCGPAAAGVPSGLDGSRVAAPATLPHVALQPPRARGRGCWPSFPGLTDAASPRGPAASRFHGAWRHRRGVLDPAQRWIL